MKKAKKQAGQGCIGFAVALLLVCLLAPMIIRIVMEYRSGRSGNHTHVIEADRFFCEKLFEKDGGTVYRFRDCGRVVWFVLPKGSTFTSYSTGKGVTKNDSVQSMPLSDEQLMEIIGARVKISLLKEVSDEKIRSSEDPK